MPILISPGVYSPTRVAGFVAIAVSRARKLRKKSLKWKPHQCPFVVAITDGVINRRFRVNNTLMFCQFVVSASAANIDVTYITLVRKYKLQSLINA